MVAFRGYHGVRVHVPALSADGLLPAGTYAATLDEILAMFPAVTPTRQALNDALHACVAIIKQLHLADQIVIAGSYLSVKSDPHDIDMVALTPGIYQMAGERQFAAAGVDLVLLDIQFARDLADYDGWLDFFSITRDLRIKGVVSLVL